MLASWGVRRGVQLIRPFDHGVGGTSLVEIDGSLRVLKAWQLGSAAEEDHLDDALELAERMRSRGVPVPALIERGRSDGHGYLVYEFIDGEWSDELGPEAVADLVSVIAVARGAALSPNAAWAAELETMLSQGDPSFDMAPAALAASTPARAVLTEARRRLAACDQARLPRSDIVHGDFAPENLLLRDGRVVGVVDWERARVGDAGLDLVGAIFDIEMGRRRRRRSGAHCGAQLVTSYPPRHWPCTSACTPCATSAGRSAPTWRRRCSPWRNGCSASLT
ncbi:MAG TPA: aminoglycoside phosphotransferase family protein [Microlunatus sp.]|nr:aminoglycoside phosphotransferase family protein [Microlunatus sp.]